MAAAGGKTALSSRLASMGFMKRAAAAAVQQQPQPPAAAAGQSLRDRGRAQDHARASASQASGLEGQQQEEPDHLHHQPAPAAAEAQADGGQPDAQQQKKYALSEKLTSMKFMQRGKSAKRGFDEAIGELDAAKQEAEWVAPAAAAGISGCTIIQERDPLPAGVFGRMSFGSFNAETEALHQQAEAAAMGKPPPSAAAAEQENSEGRAGVSVTDDDMAAGWGKSKNVLSSLRITQRTKKRQRTH